MAIQGLWRILQGCNRETPGRAGGLLFQKRWFVLQGGSSTAAGVKPFLSYYRNRYAAGYAGKIELDDQVEAIRRYPPPHPVRNDC